MRERYLTIPVNKKGVEEYECGIEHTPNMIEMILPEKEFDTLSDSGVFRKINEACGLLIDDYESETIPANNLKGFLPQIRKHGGVFLQAVEAAIQYGTFLAMDF